MIPLPYLVLSGALAVLAAAGSGWLYGAQHAHAQWALEIAQANETALKARVTAEQRARAQETKTQEIFDAITANLTSERDGVRARLDAELERLRQRPARPVPAGGGASPARAGCAGASGADLSGADAEFLGREAARADDIRAGLIACYAAIDEVTQ